MKPSNILAVAAASVALLGSAAAYAREEVPKAELALAQDAIEQAQKDGATESAPVELKTARDKYEQAQGLVAREKRKDYPRAKQLAEQAKVDADLADAKAAAARAQKNLQDAQNGIRDLRNETERQTS